MTIRPYEKLELYGEKSLTNTELLSIILRTGTGVYAAQSNDETAIKKDSISPVYNIIDIGVRAQLFIL